MSEKTGISWTDHTFNTHWGCSKISPGCDGCYAEKLARRFGYGWGDDAPKREFAPEHWNELLRWDRKAAADGVRRRVFTNSMSDLFDKFAPEGVRERHFEFIKRTPHLDHLLLTKRIGNVKAMLPADWGEGYPNVVLMATVVNQEEADRDIVKLLALPARRRGLSIEPMLGPINLGAFLWECCGERQPTGVEYMGASEYGCCDRPIEREALHWVIAGGESGPHARPPLLSWFRSLREQCAAASVPFHLKQIGEYSVHDVGPGGEVSPAASMNLRRIKQWREDLQRFSDVPRDAMASEVFQPGSSFALPVGKAAAGRLLDGQMHDAFPEAA